MMQSMLEEFRGKNVLITGGVGFIGSNLAIKLIELGANVTIIDNMLPDHGANMHNIEPVKDKVHINYGDITSENVMNYIVRDKHYIFHLAGQVSHILSLTNPFPDIDINIKGTSVLAEACKKYNSQAKIVYTSTRGSYGACTQLPVTEEAPTNPRGIHEIANLTAEKILKVYNDIHGVKSTILRLSNIYGPRAQMKHHHYGVINWFIRLAIDNETIKVFGDGSIKRDMVYVDDCIDAILRCSINSDSNGQIFNIGDDKPATFKELVETIITTANSGSWQFTPFSEERKAQEPGDYYSDISKIEKFTSWRPTTSLAQGLAKTIEYYRQNKSHYWENENTNIESVTKHEKITNNSNSMKKIFIGCAGGAPANNFIRSLRESNRNDYLIGTSCIPSDLFLANVDEKYVVPPALADDYPEKILGVMAKVKPDFIHLQNDFEVRAISRIRDRVASLGVKYYLPAQETVENCVDKEKSTEIWQRAGLRVPKTIKINNEEDLKVAFDTLGAKIWIRAIEGGGGKGALPTDSYSFAREWINYFKGWGNFTAAELLGEKSVTWMSIWYEGELVVAQCRRRRSWNFANRTLSGITGITGVGETYSDPSIDQIALDSINSIDSKPHGIFSVDMTYDLNGLPNLTEINIGRFFTTHFFFAKAGVNFAEILCNIALDNKFPTLEKKINPLPNGLLWIRGMDVEPVLTNVEELQKLENQNNGQFC